MLAIHTDKYAQGIIDVLTADDRAARFGDDRIAWRDCFDDLWAALKHGAKVTIANLGQSPMTVGDPYGTHTEMRPSKILSSHNPESASLEFAIMCKDANSNGEGPYEMVCYSARRGDRLETIDL